MRTITGTTCPRCGAMKLKHWSDLTDDEKFLAERVPASAEHSKKERKMHRFCTRCWFEEKERRSGVA